MATHAAPDDDDGGSPAREALLRPVVWLLTIFIVLVLLALPVMRALTAGRSDNPTAAARDARAYVATQFSEAALERRSTRLAAEWALGELRGQIDIVVADLQLRDAAEVEGAKATVERAPCRAGAAPQPDTECFRARLSRPDGALVTSIRFAVAIVDGRATVVAVGLDAVLHAGGGDRNG